MDTISEVFTNVWNGLFSGIDSIGDLFITIGSWFTDDDSWATNAKNYDWVSQATNTMSKFSELGVSLMTGDMFSEDYWKSWETIGSAKESQEELNELYNNSLLAELPNDTHDWINGVFSSLGQMMPSIGLSFIPGVGKAASLGYMGLSSGGRVVSDTYDETGSVWKSLLKGVGVGATEVASELVVGGVLEKLGLGTGKIGGIIGKSDSATRQGFVSELAKTMFEEETEEVFSGLMQPIWDSITEGTSAYKKYFTKEFLVSGNDSLLSQFAAGAVAGGIMGGANIIEKYARYGSKGYHLLQDINELNESYNTLKKYSQTDSRYATELNKIAEL